jgi:hypothetical protein
VTQSMARVSRGTTGIAEIHHALHAARLSRTETKLETKLRFSFPPLETGNGLETKLLQAYYTELKPYYHCIQAALPVSPFNQQSVEAKEQVTNRTNGEDGPQKLSCH